MPRSLGRDIVLGQGLYQRLLAEAEDAPALLIVRGNLNLLGRLAVVEELLGPSPVPVDEIIRLSGASSGAVQMTLLELDLAGRLDRHAGG
jgi:DNA processing protein